MSVITETTTLGELQLELAKRSVRELTMRSMPPPSVLPMNTAEIKIWDRTFVGTGVTAAAAIDDAMCRHDHVMGAKLFKERSDEVTDG
jgi:hypothetical protein